METSPKDARIRLSKKENRCQEPQAAAAHFGKDDALADQTSEANMPTAWGTHVHSHLKSHEPVHSFAHSNLE